jgi:hypothetical protein
MNPDSEKQDLKTTRRSIGGMCLDAQKMCPTSCVEFKFGIRVLSCIQLVFNNIITSLRIS